MPRSERAVQQVTGVPAVFILCLASMALEACAPASVHPGPDATPPGGGEVAVPEVHRPDAGAPVPRGWPELQTGLPDYQLEIAPADLAALDLRRDRTFRVPAIFRAVGGCFAAQVRYRGRSSMNFPKKSFEVELDPPARFEGRRQLPLLAEWNDGGLLTQKVWYDLAAARGLAVPRVRFVNLAINGVHYGSMVEIEKVDKPFLSAHGFDPDSDIYRCGQDDCELRDEPPDPDQQAWEKKTNEEDPWDELWSLLRGLDRTPPQQLVGWMERTLDLDAYLRWLAVDAVISNTVIEDSRSYLVFDRSRDRWTYVPWDLNNAHSLYRRTRPADAPPKVNKPLLNFTAYDSHPAHRWSVPNTRIVVDEGLRARLVAEIRDLLASDFTEEELGRRIREAHALLAPHYPRDPFVDLVHAGRAADYLIDYLRGRRAYLLAFLPSLESHGRAGLKIDRVGLDAAGAPFVEILNPGPGPSSLQGLYLTGRLRRPLQWPLPALSLPVGGVVRFGAGTGDDGGLGAAIDPSRAQVGLFPEDALSPIDAVFAGPLMPGRVQARSPRGGERFQESPEP